MLRRIHATGALEKHRSDAQEAHIPDQNGRRIPAYLHLVSPLCNNVLHVHNHVRQEAYQTFLLHSHSILWHQTAEVSRFHTSDHTGKISHPVSSPVEASPIISSACQ